jgi:hypothetical protein
MYPFWVWEVLLTATMTTSDPASQNQHPAPVSIWRQSTTGALALTLLASCAIAINVHNPIEAIGNIIFTVPVTFLFLWVVCTFLVWIWRKLGRMVETWTK